MEPAKAIIEVKAKDTKRITVLFNPNEYNLQTGSTYAWKTIPGLQSPIAQFISGEAATLSMDLFFDTYERVKRNAGRTLPTGTSKPNRRTANTTSTTPATSDASPSRSRNSRRWTPICTRLRCAGSSGARSISAASWRRCPNGLRWFLEVRHPGTGDGERDVPEKCSEMTEQYQETPRQSADRTKRKTLKQGEQLWMIAAEEYEDPGQWRAIAEANGIDNPRKLAAGRRLIIPRLE